MSFINNPSINAENDVSSFVLSPGDVLPDSVLADLRTDHAGETGAVFIYLGILQFTRNSALRVFAEHHMATEQSHLQHIESWLTAYPVSCSYSLPDVRLCVTKDRNTYYPPFSNRKHFNYYVLSIVKN